MNALGTQLLRQFSNCTPDGAEQCARSDAELYGEVGVADRILIKPAFDGLVQQLLALRDV